MQTATAGAFAESSLNITGFELLQANGTQFTQSNFSSLSGSNFASELASLNGTVNAPVPQTVSIFAPDPSMGVISVGTVNPPPPLSTTVPVPVGPAPGNYGYANQTLSGSAIVAGGVNALTQGAASLTANGTAFGTSNTGTTVSFIFTPTTSGTMTASFNAKALTEAFVAAGASPTTSAIATMAWSINIVDQTTGVTELSFAPIQLNASALASVNNTLPGTVVYNPATFTFTATSATLNNTDTYDLTINQTSTASVLQNVVPEPATTALLGLGLIGLCFVSRRKSELQD
jgi:hypothetical protein